ncbi:hypothetical protein GcM3_013039 [Golovinomyces cichoracearum]|uniref:Uncharacterized protein n=1 Tax=Golovinomyces cichoracearum TaxID=62708 RepID=A0A420J9G8_9PEZI|nr:hypothetical protein GcM3_013039 [Golovinomyces cichoracearum]
MTKTLLSAEKVVDRTESWPSIPTARADIRKRELDASICGWLGGKPDLPAVCSSDSTCVRDTEHKYVGCCEKSGLCTSGIYTTCLDQNSAGWFPPPVTQTNGVYICPEEQECYRNSYADGYSQFGCGKSSWATQVETTYMGQPSDVILPIIYTAVTFSQTIASSTASLTTETSATPSIFTPVPSPPTHSHKLHSKKLEPAAVAGVIIGVVNGLAIVAGLAFCVWFRKRRQRRRLAAKGLGSSRRNAGAGNTETSSAVSQMPKILPTPLRISSALASYRSPHVLKNPTLTSPTRSNLFSQKTPLTFSDHNRNNISPEYGEPSGSRSSIGLALSSDRLAILESLPPRLPPIQTDDDDDLEYHSIDEELTDSIHSDLTAHEEDVTTSVSFLSGQEREHDNFLSTASVRHVKRVRRSANGGYRLVDRGDD